MWNLSSCNEIFSHPTLPPTNRKFWVLPLVQNDWGAFLALVFKSVFLFFQLRKLCWLPCTKRWAVLAPKEIAKFPILKESFLHPLQDQRLGDGVWALLPRPSQPPWLTTAGLFCSLFACFAHHQLDPLVLVFLLLEEDTGICWCLEPPGQVTQISCWVPVINSFRNSY